MQLYPLRLMPDVTNFHFMKFRKINYFISGTLTLLSLLSLLIFKLNFGVEFAGGIIMDIKTHKAIEIGNMRHTLLNLNIGEILVQNFGSPEDITIKIGASNENNSSNVIENVKAALKKNFGANNIEYRKIDFVGPQVGKELIKSGAYALILAFIAILSYIWFRYEWQYGVGILVALLHDAILSLGFMSVTQLDFNLSSIAALLTVIGYSVNDSVVIYDRIRENVKKYHLQSIEKIIDLSANETLSRTTLTVLTTLIANLSLIIFGGEAIRSFALLIFFGIIAGTYSSIYISAPFLSTLGLKTRKQAT